MKIIMISIGIILVCTTWALNQTVIFIPNERQKIEILIYTYADTYNLNRRIVYNLVKEESQFYIKAISRKKAYGLMQLQTPTAKERLIKLKMPLNSNIIDPAINILLGCDYLSHLLKYYKGDYRKALYAYNMGITRLRIKGRPYKDTKEYVDRILIDIK